MQQNAAEPRPGYVLSSTIVRSPTCTIRLHISYTHDLYLLLLSISVYKEALAVDSNNMFEISELCPGDSHAYLVCPREAHKSPACPQHSSLQAVAGEEPLIWARICKYDSALEIDTEVLDLSAKWTHSADFRVLPASRVQSKAG